MMNIPIPFKYGFAFNWTAFIGVAFIYVITTIESTGDLTATSMLSGEPVEGDIYMERIKGGVLGDGVNSAIAAIFNTFPNTTFSQNNGVIQMTGVASRFVGMYLAVFLVILGLFPVHRRILPFTAESCFRWCNDSNVWNGCSSRREYHCFDGTLGTT